MDIQEKIQKAQIWMDKHQIDGWLLYDWAGSNRLALEFLSEPLGGHSRRCFYWIPAKGEPIKVVQKIEAAFALKNLPGSKAVYFSSENLEKVLAEILKESSKVAMEYSPKAALPYTSKVDGGTVDLIRSLGCEVVSSAYLIQNFCGILDSKGFEEHKASMAVLEKSLQLAKVCIEEGLEKGKLPNEWQVQEVINKHFELEECETVHPPIVATRENAANPHYFPTKEKSADLKIGDLLLIDLFCRKKRKSGIYADITNMFVIGKMPNERQLEIFNLVKKAQSAGLDLIQERLEKKEEICGYEVDKAVRRVIEGAGYGDQFCHRTGHHIESKLHGDGAHLDSVESHDNRPLLPGTCFSVEPGIYIEGEIGVRLECDVFIDKEYQMHVTGGLQKELPVIGMHFLS